MPDGASATRRTKRRSIAFRRQAVDGAIADVVGAERGDEDDRRPGARRRHRLVGALAAAGDAEVAAADGLAGHRQARHAHRHVRVRAADDHDLGHWMPSDVRVPPPEWRRACGV